MSSVSSSSSSTSTTGANMMRITGMATGMDTDSMVKAMTAIYQNKIDKAKQDEQMVQWKQDAYRDIIKDVKNLQDYFDPLSSKYIMNDSKFNPVKVTNSSDSTVGFTASSSAQTGNYKVTVSQLAKPAVLQGNSLAATTTTSTKLEGASGLGVNPTSTIGFTINNKTVNVTTDSNTTIQNVLDTINNDANIKTLGVTASFDELAKKFVFSTNSSGTSSTLSVSVSGGANLGLDKVYNTDTPPVDKTGQVVTGQNAQFTLNYPDGRTENLEQTSNQFTANGITYNLKSIGSADITVSNNDVDTVVNNIKSFTTDFNNVIAKIYGKLTEKKQYTYKPLTDDQKSNMKDADIANWESKAKQGILKDDDYLENLLSNLRSVFGDGVYSSVNSVGGAGHLEGSNTVDGTKNEFDWGIYGDGAMGLDTSKEVSETGQILIKDENKLRDAITKNPEEFAKFFTQKSSTPLGTNATTGQENQYIGSKTYFEDGVFARMDKIIRNYAGDPGIGKDGTSTVKGSLNIFANKQYDYSMTGSAGQNTMPDQIYAQALSITKLQTQMSDAQNRYYQKFSALETAMNNMNSQLSNFKSQMGIS